MHIQIDPHKIEAYFYMYPTPTEASATQEVLVLVTRRRRFDNATTTRLSEDQPFTA